MADNYNIPTSDGTKTVRTYELTGGHAINLYALPSRYFDPCSVVGGEQHHPLLRGRIYPHHGFVGKWTPGCRRLRA